MNTSVINPATIEYPDSDGKPMADNNAQLKLIFLIKNGLDGMYENNTDVTVEGDLLWYPVQTQPGVSRAPDVMVIFGRPKMYRGSYRQWLENNIAPQVTFEIISPGNTVEEMEEKRQFYEQYGVEEYYQFNPSNAELFGWSRQGTILQVIPQMNGWISPRLGIRFEVSNNELKLYYPDGQPFQSYAKLKERAEKLAAKIRELGLDPDNL
jgi:Uma2 family endonuclease